MLFLIIFRSLIWYWFLCMVWHMHITYFSIFITNCVAPFIELSILSLLISNDICHIRSCVVLCLGLLYSSSGLLFPSKATQYCPNYYCFIISIVYNWANPSVFFFFFSSLFWLFLAISCYIYIFKPVCQVA